MNDDELIAMIACGMSAKEMADKLKRTEKQVYSIRDLLFKRHKAKNAPHLVALYYGIVKQE